MKGINKKKNISENNILVAKEYDQKFSNVELDYQRVDKRTSWLADMKYRTTMFNHHRREFFDHFSLLGYSLKRIFFCHHYIIISNLCYFYFITISNTRWYLYFRYWY